MTNRISHELRIKYGLPDEPDAKAIHNWGTHAKSLIEQGEDVEIAGRKAAFVYFKGVDTVLLFSEADTIESLLARALAKE